MAAETFYIKQSDLLPLLRATLKDGAGVAVNLTGSTVVFSMRDLIANTLKINEAAVTIITPASGIVEYTWVTANTDTAGTFTGEFEVTDTGGKPLTFPNSRANQLLIVIEGQLQ